MNTQTERMPASVYLLSLCNAYLFVGASLLITVSALIGFELAEDKRLSTLPLALQFFSIMCTSVPASMIMGKYGRKAGFGNYYRFTAAEVVGPVKKSLAISLVMAGGVIAAFIGPNLANWSSNMFSAYKFAGPFVVLLGVYVLSVFTIAFADLPKKQNAQDNQGGRPIAQLIMQPIFLVAVICQMLGYGTMNFVMSSTPLAMNMHDYGMADTALVIQWHVVAMFAPSFITGHLIKLFGNIPVLFLGAVLGLVSIAINLMAPISVSNFVIALITLGVSWNFLYVGGTTLLTDAYEPNEKSRAQGANDLAVFSMVTVTALSTGTVHHLYGWETVNMVALPMLFVTLLAIIWLWLKQRSSHTA